MKKTTATAIAYTALVVLAALSNLCSAAPAADPLARFPSVELSSDIVASFEAHAPKSDRFKGSQLSPTAARLGALAFAMHALERGTDTAKSAGLRDVHARFHALVEADLHAASRVATRKSAPGSACVVLRATLDGARGAFPFCDAAARDAITVDVGSRSETFDVGEAAETFEVGDVPETFVVSTTGSSGNGQDVCGNVIGPNSPCYAICCDADEALSPYCQAANCF